MLNVNWSKENDLKISRVKAEVLKHLERSFSDFLESVESLNSIILHEVELSLNIELCSESKILELNTNYRNKASTTDVLSFPMFEDLRSSSDEIKELKFVELGDIFICELVCERQATEFGLNFYEEFVHLAVHGFLHILGYDHELSDHEDKLMIEKEGIILEKFKKMTSTN